MIEATNKVTLVWDGNTVHGDAKSIQAVAAALEFQAQHGVRRSAFVTDAPMWEQTMNVAGTIFIIKAPYHGTAKRLCENALLTRFTVRAHTLDGWELTDEAGKIIPFTTHVTKLPRGLVYLDRKAGVGG